MKPGAYKKEIYQADGDQLIARWKPGGFVMNITGYSAVLTVKKYKGAPTTELQLSTDDSTITIDGPNGLITAVFTTEQTAGFKHGTYYYDLTITSPAGVPRTLIAGEFIVAQKV